MAFEIEHKFLVRGEFRHEAVKSFRIAQGYIMNSDSKVVRVRIRDNEGFITIKGPSTHGGLTRYEWEKEIPVGEAQELMALCGPGVIDKTRYIVPVGGHNFEVDEFHGDNEGLVMAEVELETEDEAFDRPQWLGEEVTGDPRYYNAMLSKEPYSTWR